MNEFRKPYEYTEEKVEGIMLVFVTLLITAEILLTLILTIQGYGVLKPVPVASAVFLISSILFFLFIILTVISFYKLRKWAIAISKAYLIVRAVYLLAAVITIYIIDLNDKASIGGQVGQFKTVGDLTLMVLIIPMIYTLIFSVGWFLYFIKSRKCKEFITDKANT